MILLAKNTSTYFNVIVISAFLSTIDKMTVKIKYHILPAWTDLLPPANLVLCINIIDT